MIFSLFISMASLRNFFEIPQEYSWDSCGISAEFLCNPDDDTRNEHDAYHSGKEIRRVTHCHNRYMIIELNKVGGRVLKGQSNRNLQVFSQKIERKISEEDRRMSNTVASTSLYSV